MLISGWTPKLSSSCAGKPGVDSEALRAELKKVYNEPCHTTFCLWVTEFRTWYLVCNQELALYYHPVRTTTMASAVIKTAVEGLPKIAEGKVRDLYEVDDKTLLFVASDRISAYDVIMSNVSYSRLLFVAYLTIDRASQTRASFSLFSLSTGSTSSHNLSQELRLTSSPSTSHLPSQPLSTTFSAIVPCK